ncbi:PREDICTED: chromatin assembly factor 1 subunit A-like [Trachymyrmex septentrionalis]|uniref:chromatin assembly factor 1 subunit A-like n=1 Tax=Trachymyrmex septentrionalis TaxID=34720 RepID=UPI00084F5452|nr:PREDICTED: chromatin assembly factor 1 subunit A-like [Trachymyrmex septentrionalis]
MDGSMEDSVIQEITPKKKKKMRQAQLPFQILSSSKSPNSTDNESNTKKRKIKSPLVGSKSSKVLKLATKENSVKKVPEKKREDASEKKLDVNDDIEIILDDEKDLEQSDQQDTRKIDSTSKNNTLGKNKKLDKSQQKLGALTKFLKKTDKEIEKIDYIDNLPEQKDSNHGNNLLELKDKKDCQDISVHKETNEVCINESLDAQSIRSELDTSQLSEIDDSIVNKDTDLSLQKTDCDITILSSDNEDSSELDTSISNRNKETNKPASPVTPKTDKNNKKNKIKKLTPKQLQKRQEIIKRKEEKQKLKMEKEKKREEEKANRRMEKEEKQREKEEKERIEKEQKKKEKELKELKKQMEIEQKQKEKEAKEEERKKREEAKEEEKRKKEEERLEAERKKQKAASNFASFFVSKKQEVKSVEEESVIRVKNFMPFEIKADMRIAPICRRKLTEHDKLLFDNKCNVDLDKIELYLEDIKKGRILPRTSSKTWPLETKEDEVILLDDDNDSSSNIITNTHNLEKHRPKLLQFNENRRPPYWGTWRKRSSIISSRRPFAKDKKLFEYEIDSDDEWEEEEPGESLKGSDDEKDEKEENPEENEYDIDNEFMVPHGYLSDEEAQADEEEMEDMSPQTQKMKLKILGKQFEAERNAKTHKLKPKIIGCIWQGPGNLFPESISPKVKEFLSARQAWVNNIPIILPLSSSPEEDTSTNIECKTPGQQQSVKGSKKTKFPDEALPDLIRLVHGNRHGRHILMREFMTFWSKKSGSHLSKVSVLSKISEIADRIACPEEGPMHLKSCWYIPEGIRKQYLPDIKLSLPNCWKYILIPSQKNDSQNVIADKTEKEEKDKEKEKKHIPLITQFTKKITQEDMKKQLIKSDQEEIKKQSSPDQKEKQSTAKSNQEKTKKSVANQEEIQKESTSKSDQISVLPKLPPLQRPPKRATLISVGRGEQFPERSRQNMLAEFVGLNKKKKESLNSEKTVDSDKVRIKQDKSKVER